ncbi:adenosylcobinamide-GDP ribazoletransferase [Haladaptatus sp. YSMS36]|uniref:adenosylcobinamide-GDP ribazoletransferase n=1 Tax=Haladaptatus sp. YSMS36 TaxID=3033384 RepID=UPI0023E8D37B|nr:adenosylcobinamide-GDP ribazoletransferase [Haladaptatus sp. YSMS36]
MVLTALRGALGFLSQLPVGQTGAAWEAFVRTPVAFPLAGYVLGALLTLPFLAPLPPATLAFCFVCWVLLVTGVNHADGVADLGDALAVHGGPERRREVMRDTTVGVGAVLAVAVVFLGLATAAFSLASLPLRALSLVVVAEVAAKLGMVLVACLGTAPHEGLGSTLIAPLGPWSAVIPLLVALPVAALSWPHPAGAVALAAGLGTAFVLFWWATRSLGGVSGDVLGATNELVRVVALHAGVIAWTHW